MRFQWAKLLFAVLVPVFTTASAQIPQPAPASEPKVEAKAPVAVSSKLLDWPELARYRAANETLSPDPTRVVFYGDSITDAWTRNGGTFFPGKPYLNRGISGQT